MGSWGWRGGGGGVAAQGSVTAAGGFFFFFFLRALTTPGGELSSSEGVRPVDSKLVSAGRSAGEESQSRSCRSRALKEKFVFAVVLLVEAVVTLGAFFFRLALSLGFVWGAGAAGGLEALEVDLFFVFFRTHHLLFVYPTFFTYKSIHPHPSFFVGQCTNTFRRF